MTAYWDDWKEIVSKAKEGNALALRAMYTLVDALRRFDHSVPLDKWLEQQDFLHGSVLLVLCEHTFYRTKEKPDVLKCAFCGNTAHKDDVAKWKEEGWIREA